MPWLLQGVDPLSTICHRDHAYKVGKALAARLKELIPRQQFKVPIQAAIGARVVASESIPGTDWPTSTMAAMRILPGMQQVNRVQLHRNHRDMLIDAA